VRSNETLKAYLATFFDVHRQGDDVVVEGLDASRGLVERHREDEDEDLGKMAKIRMDSCTYFVKAAMAASNGDHLKSFDSELGILRKNFDLDVEDYAGKRDNVEDYAVNATLMNIEDGKLRRRQQNRDSGEILMAKMEPFRFRFRFRECMYYEKKCEKADSVCTEMSTGKKKGKVVGGECMYYGMYYEKERAVCIEMLAGKKGVCTSKKREKKLALYVLRRKKSRLGFLFVCLSCQPNPR
jgi:hypothetical protein